MADAKVPKTKPRLGRRTQITAQAHVYSSSRGSCGGVHRRSKPTDLLPVPEPQVHTELVLPRLLYVEVEVLEALGELSAGALHVDDARLSLNGHPLGDFHITRGQQGLHG